MRQWNDDKLIATRNRNWLPKIQQALSQQPTTIAVGALHLFGKQGLIELLRQKGYTIDAVLPTH